MKILFLGDVVGRSGRTAIIEKLPGLRSELSLDFVLINAENSASGVGITAAILTIETALVAYIVRKKHLDR